MDFSELDWSQERLAGLADTLAEELSARDVLVNEQTTLMAQAITRWIWVRASKLTSLDVCDALVTVFGASQVDPGGLIDSALGSRPEIPS